MTKKRYEYWLGDEASLSSYIKVLESSQDADLLVRSSASNKDSEDSHLLSKQGNTAVISIQGSLLPFSNWLTRAFGMTGYPDIRDALITAVEDDSVTNILLDINSPGGAANGVEDISQLITKIKAVKPVTAYTNGSMNSAAYWIGVAADKVYSSRLASVGSIGVIATHFDLTKMLEQDGVKATIFRAGEFKALGGPYEELSTKAKNVIQDRMDSLYEAFVSHVATSRGVSAKVVHEKMADGREFLGHEALQAGLVDGNMAIDEVVMKLNPAKQQNGRTTNIRMEADDMSTKKKLLDEKTVAAIEAGGNVPAALEAAADEPAGADTAATPEVTTPAAEEAAATAADSAAEAESSAPAEAADAGLVTYLKTELASANEKLMQATLEVRTLQTRLDSLTSTHEQMRGIVINATNIKRVALGGSNTDMAAMSDEGLLQAYQAASAEFGKVFPIGGKAELPSVQQPALVTPVNQAAIKAARIS